LAESQSVEIEGHCDERGTIEYNPAPGAKRARAAMEYLLSLGVAPARIKTTSYGEELPMCKDSTENRYEKIAGTDSSKLAVARRRKVFLSLRAARHERTLSL